MPHIRRQPCVFSGHRLLRNLKLQKINALKKLKINYLLIGIVTLLLAAALWPSIPWSGKPENRVAGIIARGELRISNFLLWQIAYSELYFTDELWPDFNEESLFKAVVDFQNRERRFGKTSEQIQQENTEK